MSSYPTLIDYLGDLRAPERLTVPPGGSVGPADPYLCDIAQTARTIPSKFTKIAFLRYEAAFLVRLQLPDLLGHEAAIMKRLADWCDELSLVADNNNGGMSCTARFPAAE